MICQLPRQRPSPFCEPSEVEPPTGMSRAVSLQLKHAWQYQPGLDCWAIAESPKLSRKYNYFPMTRPGDPARSSHHVVLPVLPQNLTRKPPSRDAPPQQSLRCNWSTSIRFSGMSIHMYGPMLVYATSVGGGNVAPLFFLSLSHDYFPLLSHSDSNRARSLTGVVASALR